MIFAFKTSLHDFIEMGPIQLLYLCLWNLSILFLKISLILDKSLSTLCIQLLYMKIITSSCIMIFFKYFGMSTHWDMKSHCFIYFFPFQVLFKFGIAAFLCFSNWRLWRGRHLICTIRTCEFLFVDVVLSRIGILTWIYLDGKLWIMWCMWYWNVDVIEEMTWYYTWMNEIILRILYRWVWLSFRGHSAGILG